MTFLISRMLPQSLIWFKLKKTLFFYKINSFIFNRVSPCIHGDMNFFKLQIFYVQYIWVAPILEKINKVCLKLNSYINFHFREGRLYKIISYLKILPQGGQFLFGIVVIWLFFFNSFDLKFKSLIYKSTVGRGVYPFSFV